MSAVSPAPASETREASGRSLLPERLFVTASFVVCVLGTLVGLGVIGDRVAESSGGALAADATLLAPASRAFSIWSVIYVGLLAYTVWQWLPAAAPALRRWRIGWLAGASMLLNAAWLLVTQVGWLWFSVVVIAALALVLGLLLRRLTAVRSGAESGVRSGSAVGSLVVDGTFGLYLGWVSVATCANIAAAGAASGVTAGAFGDQVLAAIVVAVAAALGVVFAISFGGRLAVALAMGWGLAWIAVGRLTDEPASVLVGAVSVVAVLVVLGAAAAGRRRPVGVA